MLLVSFGSFAQVNPAKVANAKPVGGTIMRSIVGADTALFINQGAPGIVEIPKLDAVSKLNKDNIPPDADANNYFDDGQAGSFTAKAYSTATIKGDIVSGLIDPNTGELVTYRKTATKQDGSLITDADIIPGFGAYRKKAGQYYERVFTGSTVNALAFGVKGDGKQVAGVWQGSNDTKALQSAIDYVHLNGAGKGTVFIPETSGRILIDSLLLKGYVNLIGANEKVSLQALPSTAKRLISVSDAPIQKVRYSDFSVYANPANVGQHAFAFVATYKRSDKLINGTGGFWYSRIENMTISGFNGDGLHFVCEDTAGDMANQFLTLSNIKVFTDNATVSRALYAKGQFGQVVISNCLFTKQNRDVGGTVIQLESIAIGNDQAYSVVFTDGTAIQNGDLAVKLINVQGVSFDHAYFEVFNRSIQATLTSAVNVTDCQFRNGGYGLPDDTTNKSGILLDLQNSSGVFDQNFVIGATQIAVGSSNNSYDGVAIGLNHLNSRNIILSTLNLTHYASIGTDNTLTLQRKNDVLIQNGNNALKTINSQLLTTQTITITAWDGSNLNSYLVIESGGNISLPSNANGRIILRHRDAIVLQRKDLGGMWFVQSVSNRERKTMTAPQTGTWVAGEVLWNDAPLMNSTNVLEPFFQNTVTGSPGKWVGVAPYWKNTEVSSNYTVTPGNTNEIINISAPVFVTLYTTSATVPNILKRFYNKSSGNATIILEPGVTVDGSSTNIVLAPGEYLELQYNHRVANAWVSSLSGLRRSSLQTAFSYSVASPGTTSISIPHSLNVVPSSYSVYPENANSAGITWYQPTSSAIILHYTTAPTGALNYRVSITK